MPRESLEIVCSACGEETIVRREPKYDGFKKVGELYICTLCGHEYADRDSVPFRREKAPEVFREEDRPDTIDIFRDDERRRSCRHCKHYVVNPFTQRCGLHDKRVEATDLCHDFDPPENDCNTTDNNL